MCCISLAYKYLRYSLLLQDISATVSPRVTAKEIIGTLTNRTYVATVSLVFSAAVLYPLGSRFLTFLPSGFSLQRIT